MKEYGLILNQELNPIKRTQGQKRLNTLLRHGQLPREEDGAIEFWRLKDHLRNEFEHSQYWSDEMWKGTMAKGGGNRKSFQYCTDSSGEILYLYFEKKMEDLQNQFGYSQFWSDDVWKSKMAGGWVNNEIFQYCTDPSGQEIHYLRALQGHSGRPPLQNNVLIPNSFFEYIYLFGCAVNLHSITKSGLKAGGQNSSKDRQTVFFRAQAKVESAPRYGVLGRKTACSTKWIEVLSNKM